MEHYSKGEYSISDFGYTGNTCYEDHVNVRPARRLCFRTCPFSVCLFVGSIVSKITHYSTTTPIDFHKT